MHIYFLPNLNSNKINHAEGSHKAIYHFRELQPSKSEKPRSRVLAILCSFASSENSLCFIPASNKSIKRMPAVGQNAGSSLSSSTMKRRASQGVFFLLWVMSSCTYYLSNCGGKVMKPLD